MARKRKSMWGLGAALGLGATALALSGAASAKTGGGASKGGGGTSGGGAGGGGGTSGGGAGGGGGSGSGGGSGGGGSSGGGGGSGGGSGGSGGTGGSDTPAPKTAGPGGAGFVYGDPSKVPDNFDYTGNRLWISPDCDVVAEAQHFRPRPGDDWVVAIEPTEYGGYVEGEEVEAVLLVERENTIAGYLDWAMAQEAKHARLHRADFERFRAATSYVPFAAILRGRQKLLPAVTEAGPLRIMAAGLLYFAVLFGHAYLFGVSPLAM